MGKRQIGGTNLDRARERHPHVFIVGLYNATMNDNARMNGFDTAHELSRIELKVQILLGTTQ